MCLFKSSWKLRCLPRESSKNEKYKTNNDRLSSAVQHIAALQIVQEGNCEIWNKSLTITWW